MQQLEHLNRRLLDAGVARGHVRRTITELREHYIDALRDEESRGLNGDAARQAAWTRIGDTEDIARSVLARPELRSLVARYPRTIFSVGPLMGYIVLVAISIAAIAATDPLPHGAPLAHELRAILHGSLFFYAWILPTLVDGFLVLLAARQHIALTWPLIGAFALALFGGAMDFQLVFSESAGELSELMIGNWVLDAVSSPFTNLRSDPGISHFASSSLRSVAMLAIMLSPYFLGLWRENKTA